MSGIEPHGWTSALDHAAQLLGQGQAHLALERVVQHLRDGERDAAPARVEGLVRALEGRHELAMGIGAALRAAMGGRRVVETLTEVGVPSTQGFLAEVTGRLGSRWLPATLEPDDLRVLVRTLFPREDDHLWIERVPASTWAALLDRIGIAADTAPRVAPAVTGAMRVLAYHVGSLGLQPDIASRLHYSGEEPPPFATLGDAVLHYVRTIEGATNLEERPALADVLDHLARCRAEVERLRAEKAIHGTSLHLTGLSYRLLRLLDRLELLIHLTEPSDSDFQVSAVTLACEVIRAENTRNHLLPVMRERADLLALQVVEHAARKGSKYITAGRRDYTRFFVASLGGGFIVALFALLKVVMARWSVPLAVEALLYGLNYTVCFMLIYLTGSALATKQPAMTANTIARALGDSNDRHIDELVQLVVRVWRSQFVSFAGNMLMAFPVAFALSELFLRATGDTVADATRAVEMIGALHPWRSGTLVYAAVAGVCLYAAGLISGWVDNRNVHRKFPERVAAHPGLVGLFGPDRAASIGRVFGANLGILAGNAFLGFALGSMATLGEIFGLPLDIRHVAFASAQFGTALEVLDPELAWSLMWPAALGVVLVGLINFVVSFGLSLATALEARRITRREVRLLTSSLARRAWERPLDWFFPPKGPSTGIVLDG